MWKFENLEMGKFVNKWSGKACNKSLFSYTNHAINKIPVL